MEVLSIIFLCVIYFICGVGISTMVDADSRVVRILMMLGWPFVVVLLIIDGLIGGLEDIFR